MSCARSSFVVLALVAGGSLVAGCHHHAKGAKTGKQPVADPAGIVTPPAGNVRAGGGSVAGASAPAYVDPGTAAAPAAPPVDDRSNGQWFVDTLAEKLGIACAADGQQWQCSAPGWWGYVVIESIDASTNASTIWMDTYQYRAFAKKCAAFTDAMADLADPGNGFSVICDDSNQMFRLSTGFTVGNETSPAAWGNAHQNSVANAMKMLKSIGALRT